MQHASPSSSTHTSIPLAQLFLPQICPASIPRAQQEPPGRFPAAHTTADLYISTPLYIHQRCTGCCRAQQLPTGSQGLHHHRCSSPSRLAGRFTALILFCVVSCWSSSSSCIPACSPTPSPGFRPITLTSPWGQAEAQPSESRSIAFREHQSASWPAWKQAVLTGPLLILPLKSHLPALYPFWLLCIESPTNALNLSYSPAQPRSQPQLYVGQRCSVVLRASPGPWERL